MVKVFVLGVLFLFHVSWASEPTAEINAARIRAMEEKFELMYAVIQDLQQEVAALKSDKVQTLGTDDRINEAQMNDTDLEERVTFLEFQMVNVNEELVTLTEDLIDVENGFEVAGAGDGCRICGHSYCWT